LFQERTDGSLTDVSKINTAGSTAGNTQGGANEKSSAAASSKASRKAGSESAGKSFEAGSGAADSVSVVPGRLGGFGGNDAERTGHAVCLPVLHGIAPGFRSGPGIQAGTPSAVDQNAQGRGIG
jgi:hypothetical protein